MKMHHHCAFALSALASGAPAAPLASFTAEQIDYSSGRGSRNVATAEIAAAMAEDTKLYLSVSGGERHIGGERDRALRVEGAIRHDWTSRLSTQTTAALASNGRIFARNQIEQDVSYKLAKSLVATVGGKYAAYAGGDHVTTWSGGAAYYLPRATLSYRYSLLDSHRLGASHAHLASIRIKDPGGAGATQLWLGRGTSLYEIGLPRSAVGKFTSIALQRQQPLGGGVTLKIGVNRAWFVTPTQRYRGSGLLVGISFSNWHF
jgi:YaiO family outer membrane protein